MAPSTQSTVTQSHRHLALETPLGKDALLLTSFSGHEEMSRLFAYRLEMLRVEDRDAAPGSPRGPVKPDDIVGKRVTVRVLLPKEDPEEDDRFQYFNGFVSRFSAGGLVREYRSYQAEMVPWLWFLTQVTDCRIFHYQDVRKVLASVFEHFGFSKGQDFDDRCRMPHVWPPSDLAEDKSVLAYRVQYRESCFNFVSRLMEQEGIFYYFRHAKDKHTLVLGDHTAGYSSCDPKGVPCGLGLNRPQWVQAWEHEYQYTPGWWTQAEYHFKRPAGNEPQPRQIMLTTRAAEHSWDKNDQYDVYDYPGAYDARDQGTWHTQVRMEETEARHDVARGVSNCRHFAPGHVFKPTEHTIKSEADKEYLLTAVDHYASVLSTYLGEGRDDQEYSNTFLCMPASATFRPERRTLKPKIHGSQTAVVVGPKGKEFWTDKYGRVKVQFFWDPASERDGRRSCWVRCAQLIAGKKWGAMFIPRIGQEVVVTFLEGDPDRPLITGVVYNADQMPPYDPETEPTRSYIKTNSSPDGEGYNEVRFEDKKDKEQIFIHAQRNMDVRVRASSMETVGGSRHTIIGGEKDGKKWGDQKEKVFKDKHIHVDGEQREKIDGRKELHVLEDELKWVEGNSESKVCQFRSEEYDQLWTVVNKGHIEEANTEYTLKTPEAHFETGKTVVNASQEIVLKGPGGFIKIDASGVTIEGTLVKVNCGAPPPVVGKTIKSEPMEKSDLKGPDDPAAADNHKTGQKSAPDLKPLAAETEGDSPYAKKSKK